jgi:hypothetical protein
MAHSDARAWWADVQYLRDDYERTDEARRRADEADLASRGSSRDSGGVEAEVGPAAHRPSRGVHADPVAPAPPAPDGSFAPPRGHRADPSFARHRGHEADPAAEQHPGHHAALASPPRRGHDAEPAAGSRRGHDAEPATGSRRAPHVPGNAAPDRRTIEIRGRTVPAPAVPRATDVERRRQQRRAIERVGPRPDRVAMWALLMGLLLILVAIGTADAPAVIALTLR